MVDTSTILIVILGGAIVSILLGLTWYVEGFVYQYYRLSSIVPSTRLHILILRFYSERPAVLDITIYTLGIIGCAISILVGHAVSGSFGVAIALIVGLAYLWQFKAGLRLKDRIEKRLTTDSKRGLTIREKDPLLQQQHYMMLIRKKLQYSQNPVEDFKEYVEFLLSQVEPAPEVIERILHRYAKGRDEIATLAQNLLEQHFKSEKQSVSEE